MKAIAIAAFDRPGCFRQLIDSLRNQILPLDSYKVFVSIDLGGKHYLEMSQLAESIADVVLGHDKHVGINVNTYAPVDYAFGHWDAEQVVYLEEDFVLSPDAFNLVDWYINNQDLLTSVSGVADVAVSCLCKLPKLKLKTNNEPDCVWLTRALQGWGLVIDRRQFYLYVKPVWSRSLKGTWDKHLASSIRFFPGVYNAVPSLSRVLNTGREDGSNVQGAKFDRVTKGMIHNTSREVVSFYLGGIGD